MVDLMANCTGDGCFEIEQELIDFSSMSHHEILFKGIKIFEKMIVTLTNRCRALADSLDAKDAQHAEEMENVKRAHEAQLNEMKGQINEHLTTLNNAHTENRSKAAVCERLTEGLRHIRERKYYIYIDACASVFFVLITKILLLFLFQKSVI